MISSSVHPPDCLEPACKHIDDSELRSSLCWQYFHIVLICSSCPKLWYQVMRISVYVLSSGPVCRISSAFVWARKIQNGIGAVTFPLQLHHHTALKGAQQTQNHKKGYQQEEWGTCWESHKLSIDLSALTEDWTSNRGTREFSSSIY